MTSPDVVRRKATRLLERLEKIEKLAITTDFVSNEQVRDLCAFYVVLAIEDCSSLAEHLVAQHGWGAPESAGEEFDLLATRGVIDSVLARKMRDAVGLRNVVIHQYTDVDWTRVHEAARDLIRLRDFLASVLRFTGLG